MQKSDGKEKNHLKTLFSIPNLPHLNKRARRIELPSRAWEAGIEYIYSILYTFLEVFGHTYAEFYIYWICEI